MQTVDEKADRWAYWWVVSLVGLWGGKLVAAMASAMVGLSVDGWGHESVETLVAETVDVLVGWLVSEMVDLSVAW